MFSKERKSKIFYGWFIAAACFAVTLTQGEAFWAFGVFFKPLENEFGWGRSDVSSGYTAMLVGYAISVVVSGKLADRYGPRLALLGTAVFAGLGMSLASQVQTVDQLRAFLFMAGLGAGGTWSVPLSTVQKWFYGRRKANLALSIVVCGVGVGSLIFTPLINYLILAHGWRNAYLYVGIIYFATLAVAAMVVRTAPVSPVTMDSTRENAAPKPTVSRVWTTRKTIVTPSFIGYTLCIALAAIAFQIITVHLVPRAADVGIPSMVSAAALGLMGGFSIPGRIISGIISERIGWQKTLGIGLFGAAISVTLVLFMNTTLMLYGFVFFFGLFHGIRPPAQIGILTEFFGTRSLGEIIGIGGAIAQLVGAFAPYIAGYIFDRTGSYVMAFILVMASLVAAGVVAIRLKVPK